MIILAIVASVRGWKLWPWLAVAVPYAFVLYAESRTSRMASGLSNWILGLDGEMLSMGVGYAADSIREEIQKNNGILVVLQTVSISIMGYMVMNDVRTKTAYQGTESAALVTNSPFEKERLQRISQLDLLLKQSLITGAEYDVQKAAIEEELTLEESHNKQAHIESLAVPYITRLLAFQTLCEQGLITKAEYEKYQDTLLRSMLALK